MSDEEREEVKEKERVRESNRSERKEKERERERESNRSERMEKRKKKAWVWGERETALWVW